MARVSIRTQKIDFFFWRVGSSTPSLCNNSKELLILEPKRTNAFICLDLLYSRGFCPANSPINQAAFYLVLKRPLLNNNNNRPWTNDEAETCMFNSWHKIQIRVNLELMAQIYLSDTFRVCHIFTQLLTLTLSVRKILPLLTCIAVKRKHHI